MPSPLRLVAFMGTITWLLLVVASQVKARAWTPAGFKYGLGNREVPIEGSPAAQRLDRAAANTVTNFIFFAAAVLVATVAGLPADKIALGADIFFWARIAYIPIYWAGIPYLRTLVYIVSMAGLAIIVAPLF